MSISATKYRREVAGRTSFSHSIKEPRSLSQEEVRYMIQDRTYSQDILVEYGILGTSVTRYLKTGWKHQPVFFDEPAICFPLNNGAWHVCMFRIPHSERWLVTPTGLGVGLFGDLKSEEVVLTEGEFDALTLLSRGIPAVL